MILHEAGVALGVAGVGAQEAVIAEGDELTGLGLWLPGERRRLVVGDRLGASPSSSSARAASL